MRISLTEQRLATTAPVKRNHLGSRVSLAVQTLAPGCFALTMASGIISVGLELEGFGGTLRRTPGGLRGLLRRGRQR